MSGAMRLSLAGFLAIAVAFGPARNGFGLFVPEIRAEFGLSTQAIGVIASASQTGYLASLSLVGLLVARLGPRLPVLIGGASAGLGMALIALAPNAATLATGFVLAATYAGWSWAPYNDAAERMVFSRHRDRVLSVVSTGTTFGILAAGVVAFSAAESWRTAWLVFALAALAATVLNARILPGGPGGTRGNAPAFRPTFAWLARAGSAPLFATATAFGMVSAFYWAFAVDLIAGSGAMSAGAGPVFFVMVGVAGFAGIFTGDLVSRFGLRRVQIAVLVSLSTAAVILGAMPGWWPAAGASALLYGACVMCASALLAVWSSLVFSDQPATGFSATLVLFGLGSVAGPVTLGALAGGIGLGSAFLMSSLLPLLPMLVPSGKGHVPAPPGS